MHPTRMEQIGNLRNRRDSPRGRMRWEDHESKRMEPRGSGATWTGSPKGVFAGRKHHKPRLALNNITAGVRGREDKNRARVAGHLDEIQGVVANTLNLFRNGARLLANSFGVGFIDWLGLWLSRRPHHTP